MRDSSVSIAKALAIILMVLAHSRFSEYGNYWINMFHMPLFFFFSGYCCKDKYLNDFKNYTLKRIKGIYLPFVKWCLIFMLLHHVFFSLNIYNGEYGFHGSVSHVYSISESIRRAFNVVFRMESVEQLLGGYWFLKSLFVASFIGYFTIKFLNRNQTGGLYVG